MYTTKNPPSGDWDLVFQIHALQMILFGPFYIRTQHSYGSLRIVSLQYLLEQVDSWYWAWKPNFFIIKKNSFFFFNIPNQQNQQQKTAIS